MGDLCTIAQVAEKYSVTQRQVLYAIRHKKLRAIKLGWQWFVRKKDLPKTFPLREYKKKEE